MDTPAAVPAPRSLHHGLPGWPDAALNTAANPVTHACCGARDTLKSPVCSPRM